MGKVRADTHVPQHAGIPHLQVEILTKHMMEGMGEVSARATPILLGALRKGSNRILQKRGDKGPGASLLGIPPGTTRSFKGINPLPSPKDRPKVEGGPLVLLDTKWGTQNSQSLPAALGLMVTS